MSSSQNGYTGARFFVDALEKYGVKHVFGNPGSTEVPILESFRDSKLEYFLGLHEDVVVGAAAGYASTRRYHSHQDSSVNPVGVAMVHTVAGLAHAESNIYAAQLTGSPLVVIAGYHPTDFQHKDSILSGDLVTMIDQYTKWSDEANHIDAVPILLRRAFRVALSPPTGPVFLSLPENLLRQTVGTEPMPLGTIPNSGRGDSEQINRALEILEDAEEPIVVVGDQLARSGKASIRTAVDFVEACGAGVVAEAYASEVAFPTDHPQWIGFEPYTDEEETARLLDADTLVFVGCSTIFPHLGSHEVDIIPPRARCVHINQDPWEIGKNERSDASIVGDPGRVLQQMVGPLTERLDEGTLQPRLEHVRRAKQQSDRYVDEVNETRRAEADDELGCGILDVIERMRSLVPEAYIIDESISNQVAFIQNWEFKPEGYFMNKGGGLGFGLPAMVGAAIAEQQRPDPRPVVGYIGDGSYLYYPHTLYTAARYNVNCTAVVLNNRSYRVLKNVTRIFYPDVTDDYVGMDFQPPVDFVANARSHGARAARAETPDEFAEVLQEAVDYEGPFVIDVLLNQ